MSLRDRVVALADDLSARAFGMSMAGGESPRPPDYSEGHYVGTMKTYRKIAEELRQIVEQEGS